ncbi:N-acetylmuramoyl-L-alanine amidase [Halomontanus rarus]|uniref:N-acetylmuramoyl-L-alanine amidase n=1 Tax=Halomontanus rarus TaxID=3034020 RepID=UPI0023E84575|nr:N-acetylmuramoyl-L-alanine amidase [Halovivax sp. TS33]
MYENFEWLLWKLRLSAGAAGAEDDVTHQYVIAEAADTEEGDPGGRVFASAHRPSWSYPPLTSGTFGMAKDCRAYEPVSDDTMVLDLLEFELEDDGDIEIGDVVNWADDDTVYHYDTPGRTNSNFDCRSPSDVTEFILHETGGADNTWDYDSQEILETTGSPGSVQLSIHEGGDIYCHNDLLDVMYQISGHNTRSFGVEIANQAGDAEEHDVEDDRRIPNTPYTGSSDYARPTHDQLEAATFLVDWFSNTEYLGLSIDYTWVGLREGMQDENGDQRDGFIIHSDVTGASHTNENTSGIWAHSWDSSGQGKLDGLFPALYSWLRLEANDGQGLNADDALETAEELVNTDNGDVFKDGPNTISGDDTYYVDVEEYT